MTDVFRVLPLAGAVCFCSAWGAPAWADDTDLEEIIVTSERRAERSIDVPISISKLDETRLIEARSIHPAEILNTVAGVNIHRGSGQEHLTAIRSPVLTGGAGAGSFLYLQDGVPLRAAGFANVNGLFEAGTEFAGGVEVVKGPGSVLYGSNAVHGLINVISKETSSITEGYTDFLIGEDGLVSVNGSVSRQGFRLSASLVSDSGFRDDAGYDQQKFQLRHDGRYGEWDVTALANFQNLNQETAGFLRGPDVYKDEDARTTNPNPEAYRDARSVRGQMRLDRVINANTSLSLTPYMRWTELEFLRHFVPGQAREENSHSSLGLLSTLYGQSGRLNYVAGIDLEYTAGELVEFQDNPSRFSFIQGAHYDYAVQSAVVSAYGQGDVALGAKTTLEFGARADYTAYDYDNRIDSGTFGRFKRVDDRSDTFFNITPKISLSHSLSDQSRLYIRAARGARAPQTSDLYSLQVNQDVGDIDIETLDSLELGWKGQSGTWNWTAAGFVMRKDNFFFRNADGFNVSDGKTDHIGAELSGQGEIMPRLRLGFDVSLARHRYAFDDTPSGIVDGLQVDTAPNTIGTVRLDYRVAAGHSLGAEWRHMGEYFTDPANANRYPGHDSVVVRGRYRFTDGLSVYGRIDNVFDTLYADRADFAFGSERYFPARPRTVFVGLRSEF